MDNHLQDLRAQARALPEAPGVYFWHDGRGRILYIGKAINLRSRVTSYFSTARRDSRVRRLVDCARSIRYEVTSTELEALFRESALIKREQPHFNRALLTPRKLYYLKLDAGNPDPYLEVVRETEDDGSLYFGPFHSATVVRETLSYLHSVLPLRKCTKRKPRCAPCLYFQMGTCAAPLLDEEHRRQHQEAITHLHQLLDGQSDAVASRLERKRDQFSAQLLFERAAELQERLNALRELLRGQSVLEAAMRCRHVVVRDSGAELNEMRLLLVARGRVISVRDCTGLDLPAVVRWVRAHDALARAVRSDQSELDAASVLERWVRCNRDRVRWVAVGPDLSDKDLSERLATIVLDQAPVAV